MSGPNSLSDRPYRRWFSTSVITKRVHTRKQPIYPAVVHQDPLAQARARRQGARPPDAARLIYGREARLTILPAGLTSTAKVLPHRSRPTSKRILCPGTTDEITVRSLPITWAAISDCDPSSLRMARPWSQSDDFRIAIAMRVALKATPHASTGPFRRHHPGACRTWGRRV